MIEARLANVALVHGIDLGRVRIGAIGATVSIRVRVKVGYLHLSFSRLNFNYSCY